MAPGSMHKTSSFVAQKGTMVFEEDRVSIRGEKLVKVSALHVIPRYALAGSNPDIMQAVFFK